MHKIVSLWLAVIECWMTRSDYERPKPAPDGYQKAIDMLSVSGDRTIGFEDTPKGVMALNQTIALPVLVSDLNYDLAPLKLKKGARHVSSITALSTELLLSP